MIAELKHASSQAELQRLVQVYKPKEFLFYSRYSEAKRREMVCLLAKLGIKHLYRMKCLDIGPGYGDSLDVWHELGAEECAFVEKEPWLFTHNRLKLFAQGWKANHLFSLGRLPKAHYNLIWSRGAISFKGNYLRFTGRLGLNRWLRSVESLAVPEARIVICPYSGTPPWMQQVFESRGYECLPYIEGHHVPKLYPDTWVKQA